MLTPSVKAALIGAVASATGLHLYVARYEREVRGGELVGVLSVLRDVAVGDLLREDDLEVRELPERYLDERHIPEMDLPRVVGNRVQVGVSAGDALLWTDLGIYEASAPLAELVHVGRRAVRIDGADVSFGGLLRPGDRVDVLWTESEEGLLGGPVRTQTLLENVLVLAVGDRVSAEDDTQLDGGAVTLSVLPPEAERFEASRKAGRLSLALRNPGDVSVAQSRAASEEVGDGG